MAISHRCSGRVEEDQGNAEGVRGCGRVRFEVVVEAWPGWSHQGRGLGGGTTQGRRWGRAVASPVGERRAEGWPAEEEDYVGTHHRRMRTADSQLLSLLLWAQAIGCHREGAIGSGAVDHLCVAIKRAALGSKGGKEGGVGRWRGREPTRKWREAGGGDRDW
jgi:hypothetical protein